jgi:hypothetical protein
MKIFLRYVSDLGFQSGVAEDVGVHQTTVPKVITDIATKIVEKAPLWIKFPSTEEEFEAAKADWQVSYKFPRAIGALDRTHIPIRKPSVHGDKDINRKGFPSINVQATCNSQELFTCVDVSWPGSVHDARIWRNSDTYRAFRENSSQAILLVDKGYGLAPWPMTPFRNPVIQEQHSYNKLHCRERGIIERCFGQLKQWFPILQNKMRLSSKQIPSIICCCFVLHNIANCLGDEGFELPQMNFNDNDIAEEQINVCGRSAYKRLEISIAIHNMGLHFNCTIIHLYSDLKKGKTLCCFCNVSSDLDFYLPFSVDIYTSKAFNF